MASNNNTAATALPTTNRSGSISYSSSATDPTATSTEHRSSIHPSSTVSSPINPATESSPLNAHYRPSLQSEGAATGDAPGEGGVQGLAGDTIIRRSSISQNAPGRAGSVGEAVLGALGFGGTAVERPREDQGVGEKIVALLGG
jgi:hypothetical protein